MGAAISLGRYELHHELAAGGMATVHLGRLVGAGGFGRTVAIKRLHPQYAKDPEFVKMFLDEARLAARIQHPNVVPTLDVVSESGELFLVLELVRGESLSTLQRTLGERGERMPVDVAASIIVGALAGLEAAHSARDGRGEPLHIVHRDISPQNIMVGADGVARLLDFGVAKARARLSNTVEGHLKGKIAYMAPEQLSGDATVRSDLYAIGVVLWELLVGKRMLVADSEVQLMALVKWGEVHAPSDLRLDLPSELDRICLRALRRDPAERWASALEMARELDRNVEVASPMRVAEWMHDVAGPMLEARSRLVAEMESSVREVSLDELSRTALEDAATRAVATVSSIAKAADQVVRDRARKMADKAATNAKAVATALKVPKSLEAALSLGKKKPEPPPAVDEEATQSARPKR